MEPIGYVSFVTSAAVIACCFLAATQHTHLALANRPVHSLSGTPSHITATVTMTSISKPIALTIAAFDENTAPKPVPPSLLDRLSTPPASPTKEKIEKRCANAKKLHAACVDAVKARATRDVQRAEDAKARKVKAARAQHALAPPVCCATSVQHSLLVHSHTLAPSVAAPPRRGQRGEDRPPRRPRRHQAVKPSRGGRAEA